MRVLRSNDHWVYSLSTRNPKCVQMGVFTGKEPCQSKIWNLWIQMFIQQNITSFDVSMNDPFRGFFVQVEKTPCHSCNYSKPSCPIKGWRFPFIWKFPTLQWLVVILHKSSWFSTKISIVIEKFPSKKDLLPNRK